MCISAHHRRGGIAPSCQHGLTLIELVVFIVIVSVGVVAPFDYTSLLWALLLGYWLFGELPEQLVYVGATIVTAAGLFVIWRERQIGLERDREAEDLRP